MIYKEIQALRREQSISLMCEVLGVSRRGYYKWCRRSPSRRVAAARKTLDCWLKSVSFIKKVERPMGVPRSIEFYGNVTYVVVTSVSCG